MATSMVSLAKGGQGFQHSHLFKVTKTTGSNFSKRNFAHPQIKSISTIKEPKQHAFSELNQSMFKKCAINDQSSLTQKAFNYCFNSYQPFELPKWLMGLFGFDPLKAEECPILTPPSIEQIGQLVKVACAKEGFIYTGVRDLSKYGTGDSHFYIVAAHCGSVDKIAALTGLPPWLVRQSITSPTGVLAQWAGNMMAGGGAIQLNLEGEAILAQMAKEEMLRQEMVIGRGDLTVGRDQVELSRPERLISGDASLFSFLALTMYFHALSGSVLHMQYVAETGEIYWVWVGAGGKGFNSKEANNFTAIDLNLGMWPDMANSIMKCYRDPDLMKTFVTGDPEDYQNLVKMLVDASREKRGTILDIVQRAQVSMGFGKRFKDILANGALKVRGKE